MGGRLQQGGHLVDEGGALPSGLLVLVVVVLPLDPIGNPPVPVLYLRGKYLRGDDGGGEESTRVAGGVGAFGDDVDQPVHASIY